MKNRPVKALVRIFTSPAFQLLMALVLFCTGSVEIVSMILEDEHAIGSAHGASLYGLAAALKAASEVFEGLYGGSEVFTVGE